MAQYQVKRKRVCITTRISAHAASTIEKISGELAGAMRPGIGIRGFAGDGEKPQPAIGGGIRASFYRRDSGRNPKYGHVVVPQLVTPAAPSTAQAVDGHREALSVEAMLLRRQESRSRQGWNTTIVEIAADNASLGEQLRTAS